MKKIRLGVIGLGCRGSTLLGTILATGDAQVTAVCDLYEDRVSAAIKKLTDKGEPAPKGYADYRQLLAGKECDAVYIAASWEDHARIACDAMRAGKITALEVGGACDLSECWELVDTWEQTHTPFMFMENCCWGKFELLSTCLRGRGSSGPSFTATARTATTCATKCWAATSTAITACAIICTATAKIIPRTSWGRSPCFSG